MITLKKNGKRSIFYESVKMYDPEQLLQMLDKANLKVLRIFGDYNGEDLQETSQRFIAIGTRQ